jgi:acetyl esterase/lipase
LTPVIDCNATVDNTESWRKFEFVPGLTARRMLWLRNLYLPQESWKSDARSTPLNYSNQSFRLCPPAYIFVAELDVLADEARKYNDKLKSNGVKTVLKEYKGAIHSTLVMTKYLEYGRRIKREIGECLIEAFK